MLRLVDDSSFNQGVHMVNALVVQLISKLDIEHLCKLTGLLLATLKPKIREFENIGEFQGIVSRQFIFYQKC